MLSEACAKGALFLLAFGYYDCEALLVKNVKNDARKGFFKAEK